MKNVAKVATKKVDTGSDVPMTAEQLAGHFEGLAKRVKNGSFGQRHFEALAEGRNPFAVSPKTVKVDMRDRIEWWRAHYNGLYHINPDFSGLVVPKHVEGFDRLVIVPKGLTHQKWVETARTIHEVSLYNENLDEAVVVNHRTPVRSYAIWIRDRQEADKELKSKSANDLEQEKIPAIVLLERLVAGTGYLFEKMAHMDRENWTLCAGSRYSDGSVPGVDWDSGSRCVHVSWCSPGKACPDLRARAVVS